MEINCDIKDLSAIIGVSADILGNPADSKLFENQYKKLLDDGIDRIIMDLSNVKRINSTGLAILITGFNMMTECGGVFALAGMNDFVIGALTITKLNHVFQYYDSVADAISEVKVTN
ncbi:STAS domain-containing protein [candidate division KSB1 bacterium]|nr:STAS domain-containing protein [candidate division KSB1 bacterium]